MEEDTGWRRHKGPDGPFLFLPSAPTLSNQEGCRLELKCPPSSCVALPLVPHLSPERHGTPAFGSETMGLHTSWVIFQNGERAGEDKTWPWNKESLATGTHARYPPPPEAMLLTGAPAPPPSDHTTHSFHVFEALALCQGPCQCREAGEQPSLEALAASAPSPPHRPRASPQTEQSLQE